jgi:signal transduction histidine kinase
MKRLRNLSFRRKLAFLSFVTAGSSLLLAGLVYTGYALYTYRYGLARQMAIQADIVGFSTLPALRFEDVRAATDALAALRADSRIVLAGVYTRDGRLFASYAKEGVVAPAMSELPPNGTDRMEFAKNYLEVSHALVSDGGPPLGTVYLRSSLDELKKRLTRYGLITLTVLLLSLLGALGISSYLQREISAPILDLVQTTRVVTEQQNYSVRATVRGQDELGVLVEAFNGMLSEIERRDELLRAINRQLLQRTNELARKNEEVEAFVYIVSHDLRAPLVNLQGFGKELQLSCESLRQKIAPYLPGGTTGTEINELLDEEIPSALRFIGASTAKFERLINSLLRLSRTGRQEFRPEALEMETLVHNTLDALRTHIEQAEAEVVVSPLPPAFGDATAVGQIFANLISNALRYRQPGRPARIEIGGVSEEGMSSYHIRDNGVGITGTALKKLFQVFQRFRPDLADGEGIGLATVKRLVERHGGRIWADSQEGQGTIFRFTLPTTAHPAGGIS